MLKRESIEINTNIKFNPIKLTFMRICFNMMVEFITRKTLEFEIYIILSVKN